MKKVYLLKSDYTGYYKIGVSKNPINRVKQLLTGSSENIEIIHTFNSEIAHKLESALHNFYNHYKINREWYDLPLQDEIDFIDQCIKIEKNIKLILNNESNYL